MNLCGILFTFLSELMSLELRLLPIETIRPAPYNPRKMLAPTSPAYRKLRRSIEAFGLVEPLVWNELSGNLVGGHARLRIARDLGHTAVPVSVVRLSDAEEKALNLVLNNHEAQGRYDPAKLAELLGELSALPEFELSGFGESTLRNLTLEPLEADATSAPTARDEVRFTIVATVQIFEQLRPTLDQLVRDYDLVTHCESGGFADPG